MFNLTVYLTGISVLNRYVLLCMRGYILTYVFDKDILVLNMKIINVKLRANCLSLIYTPSVSSSSSTNRKIITNISKAMVYVLLCFVFDFKELCLTENIKWTFRIMILYKLLIDLYSLVFNVFKFRALCSHNCQVSEPNRCFIPHTFKRLTWNILKSDMLKNGVSIK